MSFGCATRGSGHQRGSGGQRSAAPKQAAAAETFDGRVIGLRGLVAHDLFLLDDIFGKLQGAETYSSPIALHPPGRVLDGQSNQKAAFYGSQLSQIASPCASAGGGYQVVLQWGGGSV
jgi:hypothetical protein